MQKTQYLPALIVAKDLKGNFIHMREAEKDTIYYCPCCNGDVKIRALESKQVQKHFYHCNDGCKNEDIIHWLYKQWLFDQGSQFYIDDKLFEVDYIEVEKMYETKFGNYTPDITVFTVSGERIFFEVSYTHRKDESYSCKWDELESDVVEVDIKKLLEADANQSIPHFNYIYKDGNYASSQKSRKKRDLYSSTLGSYKCSISKDVSRYARLDSFWVQSTKYRHENSDIKTTLSEFNLLEYDDKLWALDFCKRIKCSDLYEKLLEITNQLFYKELEKIKVDLRKEIPVLEIEVIHVSKQIYEIYGVFDIFYKDRIISSKKIKLCNIRSFNGLLNLDCLSELDRFKVSVVDTYKEAMSSISTIESIEKNDNFTITIYNKQSIKINFWGNIHNQWIKEIIGYGIYEFYEFSDKNIIKALNYRYAQDMKKKNYDLLCEMFYHALERSSLYKQTIKKLEEVAEGHNINVQITNDFRHTSLYFDDIFIDSTHLRSIPSDITRDTIDAECHKIESLFMSRIHSYVKTYDACKSIINEINNCKNNLWESKLDITYSSYAIRIRVKGTNIKNYCIIDKKMVGTTTIKNKITKIMNSLIECSKWNKKYRVLIPKGVDHD